MDKEDILQKHKIEQKELNAKIQALKHTVPKGDKKKKREVTAEIAKLEAQLEERQKAELLENSSLPTENEVERGLAELNIAESSEEQPSQPRISKAQKRREKKEAEEKARRKRIEEGEKENANHSRNIEAGLFDKLLKEKGLMIYEVNPDGNCLYNSIALQVSSSKQDVKSLRFKTCEYMLRHVEQFLPFTVNQTTGDMLTQEEYEKYCEDIKATNAWGGQLELRAISQIFEQPIEVYQASASTVLIGEEFLKTPIRLSYHRHQYGLGEHYNAVLSEVPVT